ncbi:MAG: ParB/RepB/Spo0J family partition protein [Phycisphaerales bacterium]
MTTATARRPKAPKQTKSKSSATPGALPVEVKPILGVDLKGELLDIALDKVIDPAGQPDRLPRHNDEALIQQLAGSMTEVGQLQPVMLERLVDGRFCRVFGRRRIAAARLLGWSTVRAAVVPPLPDDVRRTIVAIENVQRQDLTPAEETLAVDELMALQAQSAAAQLGKPLLDVCGAYSGSTVLHVPEDPRLKAAMQHDLLLDHRVRGIAAELVAAMLGKPASWVRDRLYIGRLSDKAKQLVLAGKLPLAHAREISKVADEKRRDELVKAYAAGGSDSVSDTEAGSIEDLQDEVRKCVFALHVVPWQRHVPFAGKPACVECRFNSANNPGLFEGGGEVSTHMVGGRGTYDSAKADSAKVEEAGICTLPACYQVKLRTAKGAISAAAKRIVDGGRKPGEAKVPEYVSPAALDAKVRDRRKLHGGKGKKAATKDAPPSRERQEAEVRRNAQNAWSIAMRKRASDIEPAIAAKLLSTPGLWAVYKLIRGTKEFEATHHHDPAKAAKAANSPAMAALLKELARPGWDSIVKLEKSCGRKFGLIDAWRDGPSGMIDRFAAALGIELDAPPTIDDFLPKELRSASESGSGSSDAAEEAEPSAKRSGTKASRGRKAKSRPAVDDGGDEGGDDRGYDE